MRKGFTLIELAIVLAIAAMLIAGILLASGGVLGRAGVNSLLSNIQDLAAASREFKVRYGYFPGDLPNAGTYITANGGISAACDNEMAGRFGNGIVDTPTESACAIEHLMKAGKLNKVEYDSSANHYYIRPAPGTAASVGLSVDLSTMRNVVRLGEVRCELAQEIERKLDSETVDNKPLSSGAVTALDTDGLVIDNCTVDGGNDPVPSLLIKY